MNNRAITGQKISETQVERNADGTFLKGVSGNPSGRPKRTPAEQQAIDRMKEITPEAVEVVYDRTQESLIAAVRAQLHMNRTLKGEDAV